MRTFVVRIHDPRSSPAEPGALRGIADEIATGRRIRFASGTELLSLLAPAGPAEGNPHAESPSDLGVTAHNQEGKQQ